jgi:hypothetical protein
MGSNAKYKDSVFSFLFSKPHILRELYSAITGISLPPDIPVTINTLSDVLFMGRVNDISFTIGDILVVLMEHQSTINPNMALRLLMYIARIYEKIAGDKTIYSGKKIIIPRPEFIVLYNGTAPYPDETTLKLSNSFADAAVLGMGGDQLPELELAVKVYNINEGHNEAMALRCQTLNGYRAFIGKVREFEQTAGDKTAAMEQAVRYCRDHDILKEFLEEHATEVMNMLLTEWDWDTAFAVQRMEGREEGIEIGREKGREEIARNSLAKGLPVDMVCEITGLDIEAIAVLALAVGER